jgi:hypothetical protein
MSRSTLLEPRLSDVVAPVAPTDSDEDLYEIGDGPCEEIPPMSAYAAKIASRLVTRVNIHAQAHQLGEANAWDVVPDLAVEVISPHDRAEEVLDKVLEYFRADVRLVWVVYPKQRLIFVFEAPDRVRAISQDDALDGGLVLPGFRLPLANLFDPVPPPPAP